ncbi:Ribokinase-like protein [Entophlyctis helioformis]|nr:Ribokinase-like protein [Entophlyctis helioformis]
MPLVKKLRAFIPPLTTGAASLSKGQSGRIGVVGGSFEYTGAPFYASMAALRTGADLCHVFCALDAATVIKSYSPELVVHPYMRTETDFMGVNPGRIDAELDRIVENIIPTMQRLDVLVVGPGLSRDNIMVRTAAKIIQSAVAMNLNLVIDADGIYVIQQGLGMIQGYQNVVLTPNAKEFQRLCQAANVPPDNDREAATKRLSKALGNITILHKGESDIVTNGRNVLACSTSGSPRRCGGQGDILAGILATFLAWCNLHRSGVLRRTNSNDGGMNAESLLDMAPYLSAYAASRLTRECAAMAFQKKKRSMVASDILAEIGDTFERVLGGDA